MMFGLSCGLPRGECHKDDRGGRRSPAPTTIPNETRRSRRITRCDKLLARADLVASHPLGGGIEPRPDWSFRGRVGEVAALRISPRRARPDSSPIRYRSASLAAGCQSRRRAPWCLSSRTRRLAGRAHTEVDRQITRLRSLRDDDPALRYFLPDWHASRESAGVRGLIV